MSILSLATKGKIERPRATFIYGVEGIGKTTFACSAPDAIIISTEDGASDIEDVAKLPVCDSFQMFGEQIYALSTEEHEFKNVVIDSVDWLERLVSSDCVIEYNKQHRDKPVESITDIPYGGGTSMLENKMRLVIVELDKLRKKGMGIICIAHCAISQHNPPDGDPYDRYTPAISKKTSPLFREWADEVLFVNYKVLTKKTGEAFGKTTFQAVGGNERIIYTTEKPSHMAKNRKGLPDQIGLTPEYWSM